MTFSKMVTIDLEVEVEYIEEDGVFTLRSTRCHTIAPQQVRDWAGRMAWVKVSGGKP